MYTTFIGWRGVFIMDRPPARNDNEPYVLHRVTILYRELYRVTVLIGIDWLGSGSWWKASYTFSMLGKKNSHETPTRKWQSAAYCHSVYQLKAAWHTTVEAGIVSEFHIQLILWMSAVTRFLSIRKISTCFFWCIRLVIWYTELDVTVSNYMCEKLRMGRTNT